MRPPIDIISVIVILLGVVLVNSNNQLGWLFIIGGLIKWATEELLNKLGEIKEEIIKLKSKVKR